MAAATTTVPYKPRNTWKGSVRLEDGHVLKDCGGMRILPRLFGRISLRWEEKALRRLKGIEGIPEYRGRPTRNSLEMASVPGVPLDKMKKGELSERCFQRLRDLLLQIHRMGVAHGDLHMRNILIDGDRPYVIDFSTAYSRGRLPLLDRQIFNLVVQLDMERLYKIEKAFFGRGERPRMFFLYRLVKGIR
jgi:predicted Ser/Thr protein kinase